MKLSILIPSIRERRFMLNSLTTELSEQVDACRRAHSALGEVEILAEVSERHSEGGLSVGKKRELLVTRATGEYLCFLDDDDGIAPNYVEELLRLCAEGKDVCTFKSLFMCDTYWTIIDMSIHNKENDQATPYRVVNRPPWHVCPVKSDKAKDFQFEDVNNAEDWRWFSQVLGTLHTEAKSTMILHKYVHSSKISAVDDMERRQ